MAASSTKAPTTRPRRREAGSGPRARRLQRSEKVRLALLGVPTLALALSITVVSTYLGRVTRAYTTNTIVVGVIIGGEGFMALWIPLIAGTWSDSLRTRVGGRLPFVLAGGIPAAAALALMGFVGSLGWIALTAEVFFAAYFVAYEPYRALYPDLLDSDAVAGRSQSAQAVARGMGTGLALLCGGLLLSIATPLPFLLSAVVLLASLAGFTALLLGRGLPDQPRRSGQEGFVATSRELLQLVSRSPALRDYLAANALWEASLASMKAFVVLYMTVGLSYSLGTASLIIGGVALIILLGAAAAGKLGDRLGRVKVAAAAAAVYGGGYLIPIFTTSKPVIAAAVPFIAIGGGALMALAYAILMPLMPKEDHGALTGFYSVSRGIGILAGTVVAGLLIQVTRNGPFGSTHGFAAMFAVCAAAALASLPFVRRLYREQKRKAIGGGQS